MSDPIGIGARFRVLTGAHRGREGTIIRGVAERPLWWAIDIGEGQIVEVSPEDIAGAHVQRLADAPAEADPLFAEIDALEAVRSETWGGIAADDARDAGEWLCFASEQIDRADATIGDPEGGGDAAYRDALMRAAMLCLAAVRRIDRGAS